MESMLPGLAAGWMAWTLGSALFAPPPQKSAAPDPASLAAELEELVDLPTPGARRSRAHSLASRRDATLDDWLSAASSFGAFEAVEPGSRVETVPLFVGERTLEPTELSILVPSTYEPERPAPLLLAAHGTGGSGRGLPEMWRAVAEELGMLVVAPSEAGENEGYAFSERERLSALSTLRWMRRRFRVDPNRVYATGISRGGHLCWDLALRHPGELAGIAPMIGGPRVLLDRGQNNLRYVENAVGLPIVDLQGALDDPGLVFNVRFAFERLGALGSTRAVLVEFEDLGHAFRMDAIDWPAFFRGAVRDPLPRRVVRAAARDGEGRAFWVLVLGTDKEAKDDFRPKIDGAVWARLDDGGRRRALQREADLRTARVEVEWLEPGRFRVASQRYASALRLLLTREMLGSESDDVQVEVEGKVTRYRAKASARVLLEEFAERFDPSFLPVADVEVRL
jgi:phospholipase/carboxylesterase